MYETLLKLYFKLWNNYSVAVVNIDQNLQTLNKMVNAIYKKLEPDED